MSKNNRKRILEEFYTVNNHPDELSPAFQAIIKNWGMKPSQPLIDYLLLDIKNFYWLANKKFGDTIDYPESWQIVKNYRDKIINYFGIENPLELVGLHEEVNSFGIDKIYSEYGSDVFRTRYTTLKPVYRIDLRALSWSLFWNPISFVSLLPPAVCFR